MDSEESADSVADSESVTTLHSTQCGKNYRGY